MKNSFVIILFLTLSIQNALATTITIKKTKGRQAIIESSTPLEEGQSYQLENESITMDVSSGKFQNRQNSIQFGAQFQSLTGTNVQDQRLNLTARYGWNFEIFEFGPTLSYQSVDLGAGIDNQFLVGLYGDYNIQKNRSPNNFVWGPTVHMDIGSLQFKTGATANLMIAEGGAFITWFVQNSTTALRAEGYALYEKVSTSTSDSTLSGFGTKALLVFYF